MAVVMVANTIKTTKEDAPLATSFLWGTMEERGIERSSVLQQKISSSSNSQTNLLIGRYAQVMTTAVARMYVWGKTYIWVVSFQFQELDVQNRVSAKVPAPGPTLERMCTNSFVIKNNYPSLEIVMNPHTATWHLLRNNLVMGTRRCAQMMVIVGSLSSVLEEKSNGMTLSKAGRFSVNAKKTTTVLFLKSANRSVISREILESNMRHKELIIAFHTIVTASFLLTLLTLDHQLTLLQLLSLLPWLPSC